MKLRRKLQKAPLNGPELRARKSRKVHTHVTAEKSWDNAYGTTYFYIFVDDQGNPLVWFASNNRYIHVGYEVIIEKATVKKHDQYNGEKQTVITRAKIAQLKK